MSSTPPQDQDPAAAVAAAAPTTDDAAVSATPIVKREIKTRFPVVRAPSFSFPCS